MHKTLRKGTYAMWAADDIIKYTNVELVIY